MHVYSRDGDIYYGNVMFRNIEPMTEEEYDKFTNRTDATPEGVGY